MNSWVVCRRSFDSRWLTGRHIWSKPILGRNSVLDWDIDFKFCVLVPQNKTYDFLLRSSDSRWLTDRHIWSKPILGHNSVLDWDIDSKFTVLVMLFEILHSFFANFLNSVGHITFEKIWNCLQNRQWRHTQRRFALNAWPEFSAFH